MQRDELAEHLGALAREERYRIDAVLKESPYETTQRVRFVGEDGVEYGPYIRKYIRRDCGLGAAYTALFQAQRAGKSFRFIPRVLDCYENDEALVVVMEHVRGETLDEVVYRCDPSLPLAADVFARLCDAVCELHEGFDPPLIHRDLKPGNIMLSREGLTIIDFGIARAYREGAGADTVRFGTRAYAPPEQFGFRQTDVRSDIYALGMLLYFCLVEKTPDARVRERGFADPRIPVPLRALLMRATAFDPDERYGSVRELKRAFSEALGKIGARAQAGDGAAMSPAGGGAFGRTGAHAECGGAGTGTGLGVGTGISAGASVGAGAGPGAGASSGAGTGQGTGAGADTSTGPGAGAKEGVRPPAGTFAAHLASAGRGVSEALSRVPRGIGIAWNAAVAAVAALFVAGCVFAFASPNAADAAYPLWFLVLQYGVVMGGFFLIAAFILLDKRRLRRRFAIAGRWRTGTLVRFALTYLGVGFIALALIVSFLAPDGL